LRFKGLGFNLVLPSVLPSYWIFPPLSVVVDFFMFIPGRGHGGMQDEVGIRGTGNEKFSVDTTFED